jgi:hypothetical protein
MNTAIRNSAPEPYIRYMLSIMARMTMPSGRVQASTTVAAELSVPFLLDTAWAASSLWNWRLPIPVWRPGFCLIDSVIFPSDEFRAQLKALGDRLAGPEYAQNLQLAASSLFIETDDPVLKARVLRDMAGTAQDVAVRAFRNHLVDYDGSAAARMQGSSSPTLPQQT